MDVEVYSKERSMTNAEKVSAVRICNGDPGSLKANQNGNTAPRFRMTIDWLQVCIP
jgi:hypothetical protein